MDDQTILGLFRRRDERAIGESQQKFGAYCRSIASNILSDSRDIEEVLNETWFGAWNTIPPAEPRSLAAFLGGITRNISLNAVRKERTAKRNHGIAEQYDELAQLISSGESVEDLFDAKELSKAIDRFLADLPEVQRRIFVCRYWYFDSIDEIARRFGFSKGKVRSMLFRIRKKLRDYIEEDNYENR